FSAPGPWHGAWAPGLRVARCFSSMVARPFAAADVVCRIANCSLGLKPFSTSPLGNLQRPCLSAEGYSAPALFEFLEVADVVVPLESRFVATTLPLAHKGREHLRSLLIRQELHQRDTLGVERADAPWLRI